MKYKHLIYFDRTNVNCTTTHTHLNTFLNRFINVLTVYINFIKKKKS